MNWIELTERAPERDQRCLVYAHKDNGFHSKGIYIAWYLKNVDTDTYYFKIDDKAGDGVSSRPTVFFSHWLPLPKGPNEMD